MNWVQLGGLVLTILAVSLLIAAGLAHLIRAVAKATGRPVEAWDGFFRQWPGRFVILGIFGMALGYGMMWGPSLVLGAKDARAEKERQFH